MNKMKTPHSQIIIYGLLIILVIAIGFLYYQRYQKHENYMSASTSSPVELLLAGPEQKVKKVGWTGLQRQCADINIFDSPQTL